MSTNDKTPPERRYRKGPRAIETELNSAAGPLVARFGFHRVEIVRRWKDIVGPRLAQHARPEKILFPPGRKEGGMLTVRVDGAAAAEIWHHQTQILERVNTFYGYPAIAQMRIVQGRIKRADTPPPYRPPVLTPEDEARVARSVAPVRDETLRNALLGLARHVTGRRRPVG